MTLKGGTSQACAACKYQRRRCLPECQLAPYFPADQPKVFQNAHRLFGVSNILKILKHLNPIQKREAMRSIIYESNMRNVHPVLGCYGVIHQLSCDVRVLEDQLHALRSQIEICKMQHHQSQYLNVNNHSVVQEDDESTSLLQLGMSLPNNNNVITCGGDIQNNAEFWGQQAGYANVIMNNNNNLMDRFEMMGDHQQQQYVNISSQQLQQQQEMVQHFEGMHPFLDGGQSSFIDSKIAYESCSSGSDDQSQSFRDRMEAMGQHVAKSCGLKNERSYFGID